jgi:hypothetical protein
MIDKTNWANFPFTVDGVGFVSQLDTNGSMYRRVQNLPPNLFIAFNEDAIRELIGKVSIMSKPEIQEKLDMVNAGYTEAYIALA